VDDPIPGDRETGHAVFGVTGHRNLPSSPSLLAQVRAGLSELSEDFGKPSTASVISMLAEGADTFAAEEALARGWSLTALLPLPLATYRSTFSREAVPQLDALVASATRVVEPAGMVAPPECYREAASWMLGECDALLAIWDGSPAGDIGGTSDVVRMAKDMGKPVKVVGVVLADELPNHSLVSRDPVSWGRGDGRDA